MKEPTTLLLTGFLIYIACLISDWIFVNLLFKKYQSKIPSIWRQKTSRSYFAVVFSSLLFTCLFLLFYFGLKDNLANATLIFTILFGILFWIGFYFPSFRPSNSPVLKVDNVAVLSLLLNGVVKVLGAAIIILFNFY